MGSEPTVSILHDPDPPSDAAPRPGGDGAGGAVPAQGRSPTAPAGGAPPAATYAKLAAPPWRERVDWGRVWAFFGDERAVPPEPRENAQTRPQSTRSRQ